MRTLTASVAFKRSRGPGGVAQLVEYSLTVWETLSLSPESRNREQGGGKNKNFGAILGYIDQFRMQETLYQNKGSMPALSYHRTSSALPQQSEMPSRLPCSVLKLLRVQSQEMITPHFKLPVPRYNKRK